MVDARRDHCLAQFFLADVLLTVDDILSERALDHPGILQDHGEEFAHILACHILCADAVDENVPLALVKAHEEIDERRLARARRTDDGDLLPRFDFGGEVVDIRYSFLTTPRAFQRLPPCRHRERR